MFVYFVGSDDKFQFIFINKWRQYLEVFRPGAPDYEYPIGAFSVEDYPDLKKKFELLNVPETFQLACEVCRQYVEENTGATERIMTYCKSVLNDTSRG